MFKFLVLIIMACQISLPAFAQEGEYVESTKGKILAFSNTEMIVEFTSKARASYYDNDMDEDAKPITKTVNVIIDDLDSESVLSMVALQTQGALFSFVYRSEENAEMYTECFGLPSSDRVTDNYDGETYVEHHCLVLDIEDIIVHMND